MDDRAAMERQAMADAGVKPVAMPACRGHIVARLQRPDHTFAQCCGCGDWTQGRGGDALADIVTGPGGVQVCLRRRPILRRDGVRAWAHCAPGWCA